MLATPADRFSLSPEAVEADDAPAFAAFDELRPLAQQTVEWFQAATDLVVDQHLYDQLWGPNGKARDDPTPAGTLDDFVDHALDQFLARSQRIQPGWTRYEYVGEAVSRVRVRSIAL